MIKANIHKTYLRLLKFKTYKKKKIKYLNTLTLAHSCRPPAATVQILQCKLPDFAEKFTDTC